MGPARKDERGKTLLILSRGRVRSGLRSLQLSPPVCPRFSVAITLEQGKETEARSDDMLRSHRQRQSSHPLCDFPLGGHWQD